jgi:hypothetical protein
MGLIMLVYYDDAFEYTSEQRVTCAEETGFEDVQIQHVNGPVSMGIAHKH